MLDELISRATLEDLAGTTAFGRGEQYFSVGAVTRLRATDERISARVEGSATYEVELCDDDGDLAGDCTCPRAADGYLCKHCVAVGLAWLAESAPAPKSGVASARKKRRDPWRDITAYLTCQPPEDLIELLLEAAQRDDWLYQSLLLSAERTGGGGNVAKAFRRAIDEATRTQVFFEYREAGTFAANIKQVVDSLAELLEPDTAATLVALAEYAIERVENSLEQVDDSNGMIGGIVCRLGALHLEACTMARPEPTELAERLFGFETTLPFGLCSFDPTTYRELAQAAWRKLEPRGPKDSYDSRRATVTRIMERLAEARGDFEELVAIKAQGLSSAYRYLDVAEIWTKARQPDKALDWAERGLKAFPGNPDNRLRDFLVTAYLKRKRNHEALQLTWVQFEERPCLDHYQKLHAVSTKLGIWPAQRERALTWLADDIAREAAVTTRWKPTPSAPDHSRRVQIAMWENDADAAWVAAHRGLCSRDLLIALAAMLESARPDNAVSLYRRVVPLIVEQTSNTAHGEAIKLIRKMERIMKAHNQSRQFGDYLAELHVRFKPKRNFIKLLDGVAKASAAP